MSGDELAPERTVDFHRVYEGVAPWDVGRAQPAIIALADAGRIRGPVLDVGCGSGDNALMLAERGLEVVGVDFVEKAIADARQKAAAVGSRATFEVADALDLSSLGRRFAAVIDSGLLHVFTDASRARFAESLSRALLKGGRYFVLAFSEQVPGPAPRAITGRDLENIFRAPPWRIVAVEETRFEIRFPPFSMPAIVAELSND